MSAARFGHIADITRLRKVTSGLIRFPVGRVRKVIQASKPEIRTPPRVLHDS